MQMLPRAAFKQIATPAPLASVRIGASSTCQLQCPVCPTANGSRRKTMGWGHLAPEKFRDFLEKNPAIRHVELSHFGEIFLNPRLVDIFAIGAEKGIEFTALNGVNLNHATDAQLEALVKYRIRAMTVAIDGVTPEAYERYRRNGNLAIVLENLRKINALKDSYRSSFPEMEWQMVVFGHNEEQLPEACGLAHDFGMSFYPKLNWDPAYSPIRDRKKVGRLCRNIIAKENYNRWKMYEDRLPLNMCKLMWTSPQINWDGRLLGCCINSAVDFGNAFDADFAELLQEEDYRYVQGMLSGEKPPRAISMCSTCRIYRMYIYPYYALRFLKVADSYLLRFAAVALVQNTARLKNELLARMGLGRLSNYA